jgi:hypothetical protein
MRRKRPIDPKLAKRVGKVPTADLLAWLDTTVIGIGVSVDNWRFHGAPAADVTLSLEAIYAIWDELLRRGVDRPVRL